MSNFVPDKVFLRGVLLHYFNMKKSAAESHRILVDVYGKHALSEQSCRRWFGRFKSGDFKLEDKERPGQPKKFEDEELESLLNVDQCQTLQELSESLGVDESTVSKRLKTMGLIQKQGNWVPYELKARDVERRLFACEQFLERQKRKGFLHRIITGDEKWIHYDNPKRKKSWVSPGEPSTSTPKRNIHGHKVLLCIWWDQQGVVYYELLKPNETVTADVYQRELNKLNDVLLQKRPAIASNRRKVILLHDNARPHVARVVKDTLLQLE